MRAERPDRAPDATGDGANHRDAHSQCLGQLWQQTTPRMLGQVVVVARLQPYPELLVMRRLLAMHDDEFVVLPLAQPLPKAFI